MTATEQLGQPSIDETRVPRLGLTPLQEHFLRNLNQVIAKREQQLKIDPKDKLSLRLLSRAMYSSYMDCVANGIGDLASAALEQAQAQAKAQPTTALKPVH